MRDDQSETVHELVERVVPLTIDEVIVKIAASRADIDLAFHRDTRADYDHDTSYLNSLENER